MRKFKPFMKALFSVSFIFVLVLFAESKVWAYGITSIGGASWSGTLNYGSNSTIYICNGSAVTIYTDVTASVTVGSTTYYRKWQTSADGSNWFTSSSGGSGSMSTYSYDYYYRCAQVSTGGAVYSGSVTPWVHIVHGPSYVALPLAVSTSNYTGTQFTAHWTTSSTPHGPSTMDIRHYMFCSTDPNFTTGTPLPGFNPAFAKLITACTDATSAIAGCTNPSTAVSYTVTGLTPGVTYYWKILAQSYHEETNTGDVYCGKQSSYTVVQTVGTCDAPVVTTDPVTQTVCAGQSVTFSVTATDATSYLWQRNGSSIGSATNSTYNIPSVAVSDTGYYRCIGTNACGSDTSASAHLLVTIPVVPSFTALGPYCVGDVAGPLPSSSNNGFSGTWNPTDISTSSAGTTVLTFTPTAGQCASTATMSVSVYAPVAQTITGTTPLCKGTSATWSGTSSGGTWSSSVPSVAGVNSSIGLVTGITTGTSLITYTVSTTGGCINTATQTVTVNDSTGAVINGGASPVCYNTSPGTLTANATGGNGTYSYQWYVFPSSLISNATNSTFNPGNLSSSVTYYCIVTGSCGAKTSKTTNITVYQPLSATLSGGTSPICDKNNPGTFTATAGGGTGLYTYQWYKTTTGIINGATNSTYAPGMMTTNAGFYCVVSSNPCGTATTSTFNVVIIPEVSTPTPITVSAGVEPVCVATNNVTTYHTTAANNFGFHWSINNPAAGSIDSLTGVMTWTNGFYGTVSIQVYAHGCGLPSPQISRLVTLYNCIPGHLISGKTRYAGKANPGNPVPNAPTYNPVIYNIDNVIVVLKNYPSGTIVAKDTSNASGVFQFTNVPDGNYTLSYDKYTVDTMQWSNDVTAIDIAMLKYLVGADTTLDPSRNFSKKYKCAADVDNNSAINAIDVSRIKAKVGSPYNTSRNFPRGNWVALDTAITMANADITNITLKTICYGDFNASSSKYRDSTVTWGLTKSLPREIIMVSGEYITTTDPSYFEIPLNISTKVNDLAALGLELKYQSDKYKLVNVSMPGTYEKINSTRINPSMDEIINNDNDLLVTDEDGIIRVVYATTNSFDVGADDELIRLGFQPLSAMNPGEIDFTLSGTGVIGNQYGEENEDAYLIMPKIFIQNNAIEPGFDFEAYPNPFKGEAMLSYNIPGDGNVRITVYNALGEQVRLFMDEPQTGGRHKLNVNTAEMPSGMYTFRIVFTGNEFTRILVVKMAH